jgi:hypothetical protein
VPTTPPPFALQLVCLRALARPLDRLAAVRRNLLRYLCDVFCAPPLSIASLKTLYQRPQTLYEHQQWARKNLGINALDASAQTELLSML